MAPTNHTPEEMTVSLGGQWKGSHGRARCPAHDDRHPSLHISQQGKKETAPLLRRLHAGASARRA